MNETMAETVNLLTIIEEEKKQLRTRREKLNIKHGSDANENWFGIAMSGGGIRSATINMGILKTLNRFGILEKADYLSSVSGGGYCGSYVQGTLKANNGDYANLFAEERMDAVRNHGEYLIPGQGLRKKWNELLLVVAYLVSTVMSFVSPVIVVAMCVFIYKILGGYLPSGLYLSNALPFISIINIFLWVIGGFVFLHFVANIFFNFNLDISKRFNYFENIIAFALVVLGILWLVAQYRGMVVINTMSAVQLVGATAGLFVLGFFTNPNAISFHRYYRKQLSDCFLQFAGKWRNAPLKDMFNAYSDKKEDYIAPYPLINTCLNLQAPTGDDKFKGSKASDYFVLSPLHSGSKLTGYVKNDQYYDYAQMTLPAAVTISAAAVNPGMGIYSNPILSVLMTIFNARLGFWVSNPLKVKKIKTIIWWPRYFFNELFSTIGTVNRMVNISDGGHIENLAAYELIRRRCRLIVCVDGGEDPAYTFFDLENLVVRARNELGVAIMFREGQEPENVIRPRASFGYSSQRFAIADMYLLWQDDKLDGLNSPYKVGDKIGTFIYTKSSVTAPTMKPKLLEADDPLKFSTYKYKIYHPVFPHESTSDQFFDPIQWESYFQLGQFMGADLLGMNDDPNNFDYTTAPKFSVEDMIAHFDNGRDLFAKDTQESGVSTRGLDDVFDEMPQPNFDKKLPQVPTFDTTKASGETGYRM
jgi:hypothetical protein